MSEPKSTDQSLAERQSEIETRKKIGQEIDPETAEVMWDYGHTIDPYDLDPDLPEEYRQIGRRYFARSPGRKTWVSFYDLPDATGNALWKTHESVLGFPAGLV